MDSVHAAKYGLFTQAASGTWDASQSEPEPPCCRYRSNCPRSFRTFRLRFAAKLLVLALIPTLWIHRAKTRRNMRTLRIFKIGAVTLGLVAATLGTLNSRLATRQVAAVSAAPLPACTNYTFTQSTGASVVPGSTNINSCISQGCVTQVTLPFSYMLYGQSFTTVEVSSEGNIQFVGSSTASSNTCLPAAGFSSTIFAFWDIQFEQQIFTSVSGSMPNRIFN